MATRTKKNCYIHNLTFIRDRSVLAGRFVLRNPIGTVARTTRHFSCPSISKVSRDSLTSLHGTTSPTRRPSREVQRAVRRVHQRNRRGFHDSLVSTCRKRYTTAKAGMRRILRTTRVIPCHKSYSRVRDGNVLFQTSVRLLCSSRLLSIRPSARQVHLSGGVIGSDCSTLEGHVVHVPGSGTLEPSSRELTLRFRHFSFRGERVKFT